MKISKSIQRRTIIFTAAAAMVALFSFIHLSAQLFYSTSSYDADVVGHTFIGELDTSFSSLNIADDYDEFAYTIERDAQGQPLVEALPTSVMLFSKNPDYVRPEHFGWSANNIVTYVALGLFVVVVVLIARVVLSAIYGFRTGNIFRHNQPRLLRWLAFVIFFYYVLVENRECFRMYATKDLYGHISPIELWGSITIGVECLMTPLLLFIFAELMTIAARINEEESMTI